jgi:hypothetical protein
MLQSKYNDPHTRSSDRCVSCGQADYILIEEGPHIARRCRNCGKWARWVPRTDENLAACEKPTESLGAKPTLFAVPDPVRQPQKEHQAPPSPPAAVGCDHTRQLDLLIESLNGCNRHLSIITRALMGQPMRKEAGQ